MSLITKEGLMRLKSALETKNNEKSKALDAMSYARSLGDFSENAELDAAKITLARCESDILALNQKIASAIVFDPKSINKELVGFSAIVTIEDANGKEFTYQLLGEDESDVSNNIISITSPLGRSLIGRKIKDSFKANLPRGEEEFDIISISYPDFE